MNLCNIHFHKNAEHKGGEFTQYAGNGDGHGFQSGYEYSGKLSASELKPAKHDMCPSKHGGLSSGDTIEVHYVHSTAQIEPGPTLGSCLSDAINNPQLRVETQVYVLVNDSSALDFTRLTKHEKVAGLHQYRIYQVIPAHLFSMQVQPRALVTMKKARHYRFHGAYALMLLKLISIALASGAKATPSMKTMLMVSETSLQILSLFQQSVSKFGQYYFIYLCNNLVPQQSWYIFTKNSNGLAGWILTSRRNSFSIQKTS